MDKLIRQACKVLDVEPGKVVGSAIRDDWGTPTVILLVDYGIGGTKKFKVPVADAEAWKPPKATAPSIEKVDDAPPVKALLLDSLTYKELQAMAVGEGIKANQSRAKLIEQLGG